MWRSSGSLTKQHAVESSWNLLAHGDAREGKWRENWRMEWVVSTLTLPRNLVYYPWCAHLGCQISAASSRLNWRLRRFKWTRPFRRKTKSGFCACAITFQTQSTFFTHREWKRFINCNAMNHDFAARSWDMVDPDSRQTETVDSAALPAVRRNVANKGWCELSDKITSTLWELR